MKPRDSNPNIRTLSIELDYDFYNNYDKGFSDFFSMKNGYGLVCRMVYEKDKPDPKIIYEISFDKSNQQLVNDLDEYRETNAHLLFNEDIERLEQALSNALSKENKSQLPKKIEVIEKKKNMPDTKRSEFETFKREIMLDLIKEKRRLLNKYELSNDKKSDDAQQRVARSRIKAIDIAIGIIEHPTSKHINDIHNALGVVEANTKSTGKYLGFIGRLFGITTGKEKIKNITDKVEQHEKEYKTFRR